MSCDGKPHHRTVYEITWSIISWLVGDVPLDLLQWINKTIGCPNCSMNRSWFLRCFPSLLQTIFKYDDEHLSAAEIADSLLMVEECAFTSQVAKYHKRRQHNHLRWFYERRLSLSNSSRDWRSPLPQRSYDWRSRGRSRAAPRYP